MGRSIHGGMAEKGYLAGFLLMLLGVILISDDKEAFPAFLVLEDGGTFPGEFIACFQGGRMSLLPSPYVCFFPVPSVHNCPYARVASFGGGHILIPYGVDA